jgi:hypothetical protein
VEAESTFVVTLTCYVIIDFLRNNGSAASTLSDDKDDGSCSADKKGNVQTSVGQHDNK